MISDITSLVNTIVLTFILFVPVGLVSAIYLTNQLRRLEAAKQFGTGQDANAQTSRSPRYWSWFVRIVQVVIVIFVGIMGVILGSELSRERPVLTPSLTRTTVAMPTVLETATQLPTLTPITTPTPVPSLTPPSPLSTATRLTALPTATRRLTQTATPILPTKTPTISVPPGLYVKIIQPEVPPAFNVPVVFKVTFLNTTGDAKQILWFVKIFQRESEGGLDRSIGDTKPLETVIQPGSSEFMSSEWRTGPGACIFTAEAYYIDRGQITALLRPAGRGIFDFGFCSNP